MPFQAGNSPDSKAARAIFGHRVQILVGCVMVPDVVGGVCALKKFLGVGTWLTN